MDTCALSMVAMEKQKTLQARLTFAMARHAVTDIAQTLRARPQPIQPDRLPPSEFERLRASLTPTGIRFCAADAPAPEAEKRLRELREMYEPYVNGLAQRLIVPLPPWIPAGQAHYNWRTTAWQRSVGAEAASALVDDP